MQTEPFRSRSETEQSKTQQRRSPRTPYCAPARHRTRYRVNSVAEGWAPGPCAGVALQGRWLGAGSPAHACAALGSVRRRAPSTPSLRAQGALTPAGTAAMLQPCVLGFERRRQAWVEERARCLPGVAMSAGQSCVDRLHWVRAFVDAEQPARNSPRRARGLPLGAIDLPPAQPLPARRNGWRWPAPGARWAPAFRWVRFGNAGRIASAIAVIGKIVTRSRVVPIDGIYEPGSHGRPDHTRSLGV